MAKQHLHLDSDNTILYADLSQRLKNKLHILPDKPEETAKNTLAALWHCANNTPLSVHAASHTPLVSLDKNKHSLLISLVETRIKGTPLAYITGRQNFMGLELLCNEAALIPRKETELLAEACLQHLLAATESSGSANVLDLFTGSGNLPLCFKKRVPQAQVFGADLSEKAITLAQKNAEFLGLQVQFLVSDMFSAFTDAKFTSYFDLISGAPPYISSANVDKMADEISGHEPSMAFEAGPFGIKFFTQMIKESPRLLKPRGKLLFEVGLGQGEGIAKRLKKNKSYENIRRIRDENGNVRVLEARLAG
ncbi:MAG: peptide chain release factor N(5)-glutamine methyltransferase [Desulfobulbus sp.]|nr:MAG: peptide chain release factor N(5)-glutamine methyltransferase [Desulfobulbus sp.]